MDSKNRDKRLENRLNSNLNRPIEIKTIQVALPKMAVKMTSKIIASRIVIGANMTFDINR